MLIKWTGGSLHCKHRPENQFFISCDIYEYRCDCKGFILLHNIDGELMNEATSLRKGSVSRLEGFMLRSLRELKKGACFVVTRQDGIGNDTESIGTIDNLGFDTVNDQDAKEKYIRAASYEMVPEMIGTEQEEIAKDKGFIRAIPQKERDTLETSEKIEKENQYQVAKIQPSFAKSAFRDLDNQISVAAGQQRVFKDLVEVMSPPASIKSVTKDEIRIIETSENIHGGTLKEEKEWEIRNASAPCIFTNVRAVAGDKDDQKELAEKEAMSWKPYDCNVKMIHKEEDSYTEIAHEETQVCDLDQHKGIEYAVTEKRISKINEYEVTYTNRSINIEEHNKKNSVILEVMSSMIENIHMNNVDGITNTNNSVEEKEIEKERLLVNDELGGESISHDCNLANSVSSITNNPNCINENINSLSKEMQIELTRIYYNRFSKEYIAEIDRSSDSSCTRFLHRNAFMGYLQHQRLIVRTSKRNTLSPFKNMARFIIERKNDRTTHASVQSTYSTESTSVFPFQIIDLGCGDGRDTLHFASLGHHMLSIDYSASMLQHAKENVVSNICNAHYLNVDMRYCSAILLDQSVDGIWANASLIHLPKKEMRMLLNSMYSKIKVGGVMYFNLKMSDAGETFESGSQDSRQQTQMYRSLEEQKMVNAKRIYSYYTFPEVKEMLNDMKWEILEMGEDYPQSRGVTYATHPWIYVFLTRIEK